MGLDMYLYKKTYVKNWEHTAPEYRHKIVVRKDGKIRKDIKPERISYIIEQVGYWRKFNALHGWLVQNCANGEDNCQEIYVSKKMMDELLNILLKVKSLMDNSEKKTLTAKDWNDKDYEYEVYECEDEVRKLLSPTEGFFFGDSNIDEYYKEQVEYTIDLMKNLLKEIKQDDYFSTIFYQASW